MLLATCHLRSFIFFVRISSYVVTSQLLLQSFQPHFLSRSNRRFIDTRRQSTRRTKKAISYRIDPTFFARYEVTVNYRNSRVSRNAVRTLLLLWKLITLYSSSQDGRVAYICDNVREKVNGEEDFATTEGLCKFCCRNFSIHRPISLRAVNSVPRLPSDHENRDPLIFRNIVRIHGNETTNLRVESTRNVQLARRACYRKSFNIV